ncbi:MAG: M23 family metallopeptidase [Pyrinomonadaceae bacterium]
MQKNDSFFTTLLSHFSNIRIFINKLTASKKPFSLIFTVFASILAITSLGIFIGSLLNLTNIDGSTVSSSAVLGNLVARTETKEADYSRPGELTLNSGGPLALATNDGDIDDQLKLLQTTANQAFIPSIWAHMGKINNEFGFRRNPFGGRTYEFHAGMDIDGERGDLVVAPANGTVVKSSWQGGYGNLIEIDHGNGLTTRYGHLAKSEVAAGEPILRGQLIGFVGSTGRSTGPHLHYELRLNDKPINPRRFLPPEVAEVRKLNG